MTVVPAPWVPLGQVCSHLLAAVEAEVQEACRRRPNGRAQSAN